MLVSALEVAALAAILGGCGPDRRNDDVATRDLGTPARPDLGKPSPGGASSRATDPNSRATRRALIVGVSKYADGAIPALEYARSDAESVYGFIVDEAGGGYPRENVTLLVDEDATRERLRAAILGLNQVTKPEDAILFYFAGHGAVDIGPAGEIRGNYLLPTDARAAERQGRRTLEPASALGIAQLQELFQVNRAQSLLIVLDSCFSGDGGRSFSRVALDQRQQAQVDAQLESLKDAGAGRAVITATAPNQPAIEGARFGGGLFTHYFLLSFAADADRDGKVTLYEAYDYLSKKVGAEAAKIGRVQTPTMKVNQIFTPVLRVLPRMRYGLGLTVRYQPNGMKVTGRAVAPTEPERAGRARGYSVEVDAWDTPVALNVCLLRFTLGREAKSARLLPDGEVAFEPRVTIATGRRARYPDEGDTGTTEASLAGAAADADALFVLVAASRELDTAVLDRIEQAALEAGGRASSHEFVRRISETLEAAEELKDAALLYAWVREGAGAPDRSLLDSHPPVNREGAPPR